MIKVQMPFYKTDGVVPIRLQLVGEHTEVVYILLPDILCICIFQHLGENMLAKFS